MTGDLRPVIFVLARVAAGMLTLSPLQAPRIERG